MMLLLYDDMSHYERCFYFVILWKNNHIQFFLKNCKICCGEKAHHIFLLYFTF